MNALLKIIKISFLVLFIFLAYNSFTYNTLKIKSNDDILKVKYANDQFVSEISSFDNHKDRSLYRKKTDKFYNCALSGIFINALRSALKINNKVLLRELLEKINIVLLILTFSFLLIWLNIEFSFCAAFFAGLSILLSPYYATLSNLVTINVFSILLPGTLLSFLLIVERLKKTYLQKQITFCLFLAIVFRLSISYRSIFFIIFTTLLISFYHGFYYKWEKRFALNRIFSFLKVMIFSFFGLSISQVGIDSIFNKVSFFDSINNLINNISFNLSFKETGIKQALLFILNKINVYPHISCLTMLIVFFVISLLSFIFYYKIMQVHQRQFYALFLMSFVSYILVIISSVFETPNSSYVGLLWMYPATIFSFSILGLLVSNIYKYFTFDNSESITQALNETVEN